MSDWIAAEYAHGAQLQQVMADEALSLLHLHGNEVILDVGCGDGRITARIAANVVDGFVVGIDPSRDMIASAVVHFPVGQIRNLRFEIGDGRALPHRRAFDLIVSFNALHWIPDQDAALASIAAALRPAGQALLRLVPQGPRQSLETVVEQTRHSPRWSGYFEGFCDPYLHLTPEHYAAAAERNGLRVVRLRTTDKAWPFESRQQFAAFCTMGCRAWTRRLPQHEGATFIDDVLTRYAAATGQDADAVSTFRFYQMDITLALA